MSEADDAGREVLPPFDPTVLQPKFQLWVHGMIGTRVLSPTPASAFETFITPDGIHAAPTALGSEHDLVLWFPFPWPATIPQGQHPVPVTAIVLYSAHRCQIKVVDVIEGSRSPGGDHLIAEAIVSSLGWTGNHVSDVDANNVAILELKRQPKFGLAVAIGMTFAPFDASDKPAIRIASVGLECRIPPPPVTAEPGSATEE